MLTGLRPKLRILRENYRSALPEWTLSVAFLLVAIGAGAGNRLAHELIEHMQYWIAYELWALLFVPAFLWVFQRIDNPRPSRLVRLLIVAVVGGVFLNRLLLPMLQFGWPFLLAKALRHIVEKPAPEAWRMAAATSAFQVMTMVYIVIFFIVLMLILPFTFLNPVTPIGSMLYASVYFAVIGVFMAFVASATKRDDDKTFGS